MMFIEIGPYGCSLVKLKAIPVILLIVKSVDDAELLPLKGSAIASDFGLPSNRKKQKMCVVLSWTLQENCRNTSNLRSRAHEINCEIFMFDRISIMILKFKMAISISLSYKLGDLACM